MQALDQENKGCFNSLTNAVIAAILNPPGASVQLIRTWLLELFVRGIVPINDAGIKKLDALSTPLDRRQCFLIKGRKGSKNFFRMNKAGFDHFSPFERPCLVWGASCLPADEYTKWLNYIKPLFGLPTGALYLKWAQSEQKALNAKLRLSIEDHD